VGATLDAVPASAFGAAETGSGWAPIAVPGNWTMQGHDKPHYTNVQMPFSNTPPVVPDDNACRGTKHGFVHRHRYSVRPGGVILAEHNFVMDEGIADVPRLGVRLQLAEGLEPLTWFGHGPHESYVDRKAGAAVGCYQGTVAEQYVPYIVPQEHGNKEAARWFSLCDAKGIGLQIQAQGPLSFSASHLTPEDLTKAYHTHELAPRQEITVLMDAAQRGLGTASCGPDTLEQYRIANGSYRLRYAMIALNGKSPPPVWPCRCSRETWGAGLATRRVARTRVAHTLRVVGQQPHRRSSRSVGPPASYLRRSIRG